MLRLTVTTTDLRTQQLPALAGELASIDSGYRGAAPCITALLARVAHVDATVVALPTSVTVRCYVGQHYMRPLATLL